MERGRKDHGSLQMEEQAGRLPKREFDDSERKQRFPHYHHHHHHQEQQHQQVESYQRKPAQHQSQESRGPAQQTAAYCSTESAVQPHQGERFCMDTIRSTSPPSHYYQHHHRHHHLAQSQQHQLQLQGHHHHYFINDLLSVSNSSAVSYPADLAIASSMQNLLNGKSFVWLFDNNTILRNLGLSEGINPKRSVETPGVCLCVLR